MTNGLINYKSLVMLTRAILVEMGVHPRLQWSED